MNKPAKNTVEYWRGELTKRRSKAIRQLERLGVAVFSPPCIHCENPHDFAGRTQQDIRREIGLAGCYYLGQGKILCLRCSLKLDDAKLRRVLASSPEALELLAHLPAKE